MQSESPFDVNQPLVAAPGDNNGWTFTKDTEDDTFTITNKALNETVATVSGAIVDGEKLAVSDEITAIPFRIQRGPGGTHQIKITDQDLFWTFDSRDASRSSAEIVLKQGNGSWQQTFTC
ncbi:hypothetical protein BKA62DRAFT_60797 [Auriculariales sp. MPI-PUGE-AT-0066]|nr:hypothetical protein BKA62DRAFT_60797 [Auriculariales sp. MPI-PUGE-AT-0066]